MKNSMKNILKSFLVAAFAVALFSAVTPNAQAAQIVWNRGPKDCPAVIVANHTTQVNADKDCWGPSVSAEPGQTVDVQIYYDNTSTVSAPNTIAHLNQPTSAPQSSFNFSGYVASGSD